MATLTKQHPKMDRKLISNEPYEIRWVQVIFYYFKGNNPVHPTKAEIKPLIKLCNNSREKVYDKLEDMGYINILKK